MKSKTEIFNQIDDVIAILNKIKNQIDNPDPNTPLHITTTQMQIKSGQLAVDIEEALDVVDIYARLRTGVDYSFV